MWDTSVPWIDLAMRLESLEAVPEYPLPGNYGWRFFRPGDEEHWARIEISCGEFAGREEALKRFRREFPTDEGLAERMIFLTDSGVPFATATAWHEDDATGHLHYVGVDEAHQGKGLSKPLVSLALQRMKELGYRGAVLTTQTVSWVAVNVYHHFGFRPMPFREGEAEGWKIVSEKTGKEFKL